MTQPNEQLIETKCVQVTVSRLAPELIEKMEKHFDLVDAEYGVDLDALRTLQTLVIGYDAAWDEAERLTKRLETMADKAAESFETAVESARELEQVKAERDNWKNQLKALSDTAWDSALEDMNIKNENVSLRTELSAKDKVQERMMEEIESLREYVGRHAAGGSVDARQLLSRYTEVYPILSQYKGESTHENK